MGLNNALLVVDVQEGFVNPDTKATAEKIKDVLEGEVFESAVFTRFRNAENSPYREILDWNKMTSPEECQIWSGIKERAHDVFDKFSYTALTPEFKARLSAESVERIFIAGFDTDCCVALTAAGLFELGVKAVVLADYCFSNGGLQSHEAGLTVLGRMVGRHNILRGLDTSEKLKHYLNDTYFNQGEAI